MSTLGYRQGSRSGEAIPAIIHPSYVAGGQTWTVFSGVKKDVLNTVHLFFVTQRAYVLSPNVGPADIEDVQDDLMDALKPEKLEGMAPKMILCGLGEWT